MNIKETLQKAAAYPMMLLLVMMYLVYAVPASAAPITTRSLSLSNASPAAGATVTYLFTFTLPSNSSVHHVDMQFDSQPGMGGGLPSGLVGSTAGSSSMSCGTQTVTWSSPTSTMTCGTPAAQTGSKTITLTSMTNPTTATGVVFYAKITTYSTSGSTSPIDSGVVASATVPVVTVTGTQLESLTASVAAKTSGTVCSGTTVLNTTTATAINFGNFNGTTAISAAQTVTIGSNATSGVSAKLVENQILTGPSTIADFGTGTDLVAGTAWSDGSSTGFGVCAKGGDANTTNFGAGGTLYKSLLTNAKTIASTAGPTNSTGTDVEFRVAVPANLQAGVYTNTITYNILANY